MFSVKNILTGFNTSCSNGPHLCIKTKILIIKITFKFKLKKEKKNSKNKIFISSSFKYKSFKDFFCC